MELIDAGYDDTAAGKYQRSTVSKHAGHDPADPRVAMVEDMACDQCSACSEGEHRWRGPDGQFAHPCPTHHEADECEAHNTLRIAIAHGVPLYTGAELEFPTDD